MIIQQHNSMHLLRPSGAVLLNGWATGAAYCPPAGVGQVGLPAGLAASLVTDRPTPMRRWSVGLSQQSAPAGHGKRRRHQGGARFER